MAEFIAEVSLQAPVEEVFDFLTQPRNVVKVSHPDMGLRFLTAPERFSVGDEFEFAVQTFGMVQKIKHRIVEMIEPFRFVEELVKGPVPAWSHSHEFVSESPTKTRVIDTIEFEPPRGLIGMMLTESTIQEHLDQAFYYQHQQLEQYLTT